jgi:hypothetical protein
MRVHNVHTRELEAPAERVGSLIDGVGSARDRLWPAERWRTTPFVLEGPLAVGTHVRQGLIRQVVEFYEPGRRLAFRFSPGLGLDGTHGLEVTPTSATRSRLTHTLTCRVGKRLLPLYPILIREHDALVEDLFDRAELEATGTLERPARWPVSVRIANAVELHATSAFRRVGRRARTSVG